MGKMKELAICIDEIMEKIEEYLSDCDDIEKIYIYNSLPTICKLRANQLTDEMIHKSTIKENKND